MQRYKAGSTLHDSIVEMSYSEIDEAADAVESSQRLAMVDGNAVRNRQLQMVGSGLSSVLRHQDNQAQYSQQPYSSTIDVKPKSKNKR